MRYIQEDLTTTSYPIPGVTYPMTDDLEAKFWQYKSFSKLIIQNDSLVDIVMDEERKAAWEAEQAAAAAQPMSTTTTLSDRVAALEAKVAKLEGGGA